MSPEGSFIEQVADGYEHLYDMVSLRTHSLRRLVATEDALSAKDLAWRLHHLLLDTVEEMDPGPDAPPFSREWRRHRLMVWRFCDGLHPQDVAERLAISERSYYRELRDAIEAAARLLQETQSGEDASAAPPDGALGDPLPADRAHLLRIEAGRLASESHQVGLETVVANAVDLVQHVCVSQGIALRVVLDQSVANYPVQREALRQILLGTLSHLIQSFSVDSIEIRAARGQNGAEILVRPGSSAVPMTEGEAEGGWAQRLTALCALAGAQGIRVTPLAGEGEAGGICLNVPCSADRTVLVIDDNEDLVLLFARYLAAHGLRMISAGGGQEALALATRRHPDAITLDLMMPEQDGWDTLVTLTNQPETQHIPVIVCSVLGAEALSRSLGASYFLEKPVSEGSLLSALRAVGL